MKIVKHFILLLVFYSTTFGQNISGKEILIRIDKNMNLNKAISITKMTIKGRTGSRTIESKSWIQGKDTAFVEYLNPARERGKKMLRLGDKLWNYIPEPSDRIISISGHLLRQSVMGSDLSYEDFMDNNKLSEDYSAIIEDEVIIENRKCYLLELTALNKSVTYQTRKIWVDKTRWLPLREERFAKSGKLLKKTEIVSVQKIGERWYPKKMIFKDMLSKGEGTEYHIEKIEFVNKIPSYIFSKASLRK